MLYLCAHRVSKCTHVPIFFCVYTLSCGIYLYLLIDNIDIYLYLLCMYVCVSIYIYYVCIHTHVRVHMCTYTQY